MSTDPQSDKNVNVSSSLAEVLNRIAGRFIPEAPKEEATCWERYVIPYIGAVAFWLYSLPIVYTNYLQATQLESEFLTWSFFVFVVPSLLAGTLPMLVGASFKRGKPLTFFFLGLGFPALAMLILQGALPLIATTSQ